MPFDKNMSNIRWVSNILVIFSAMLFSVYHFHYIYANLTWIIYCIPYFGIYLILGKTYWELLSQDLKFWPYKVEAGICRFTCICSIQISTFLRKKQTNNISQPKEIRSVASDMGLHCLPMSHKKMLGLCWLINVWIREAVVTIIAPCTDTVLWVSRYIYTSSTIMWWDTWTGCFGAWVL